MRTIKKIVKTLLPPGTVGFRLAHAFGRLLGLVPPASGIDNTYSEWVVNTEPNTWTTRSTFKYEPLISIVVPVFNAPDFYLYPMVYSVTNQKYQNWELILVNASTSKACREMTRGCKAIDNRIRVVELQENKGIALNTNAGLAECTGDYIALLDHDDLLSPYALSEVVNTLQGSTKPQLIYSDEDKLSDDGEYRFDPHFKPAWSPQMLKGVNYLNHFTVMENALIKEVEGYRIGFDGAQDYDLYLRIMDKKPRVAHIPKILYHWRAAKNSTAQNFSIKKGVTDSGERALKDHFKRREVAAAVHAIPKKPGFYSVAYDIPKGTTASILVFPAEDKNQQQVLIAAIARTFAANKTKAEIITTASGDRELDKQVKIITADTQKLFLDKALVVAHGDFVIAVNAGVIPKTKNWIDQLGGLVCQLDEVGVVGPMLIDKASSTVLDAGYAVQQGQPIPLSPGTPPGTHTYFGNNDWPRNVQQLSGRVWAARTAVARKYHTDHGLAYQKLLDDELQVVFWPFVRFNYYGDLKIFDTDTAYFSSRLRYVKGQVSLPRTINLPAQRSDDDV